MTIDVGGLTSHNGYLEGDATAVAPELARAVADYKQAVVRRYLSLNGDEIDTRLGGTSYHVTRKYDGELAVIFFDGERAVTVNTGGRIRTGLPVHDEAAAKLRAAGLTSAVIPAELHAVEDAGRSRVFDVAAALAADPSRLRLAPFEIVSTDGVEHRPGSYSETYAELTRVFDGDLVRPVQMASASSRAAVRELYDDWVTAGGAEGLVVRTDLPIVYKVKPVYTLDVAVIGYSENPDAAGQVRSLLVALAAADGRFQPVGHVGSGLTEATRAEFHALLSASEVASSYIETDANHVAFHLVRPHVVVELKVNDLLFESVNGPVTNPLLEFDGGWTRTGTTAGVSIIHPVLVRRRDDKAVNATDVRLAQVDEHFAWPTPPRALSDALPASDVLRREVFTKTMGGRLMVQKFLMWRTNKAAHGYPEYVVAYTNFSAGRKDPLATEVRICATQAQAAELTDDLIADKVKAGWTPVSA